MTTQQTSAAMQAAEEGEAYGHYSMVMEWDPDDRNYVVSIPELPGRHTHGTTYEEATRKGRDAMISWIDANRHWGHPIPPARYWAP